MKTFHLLSVAAIACALAACGSGIQEGAASVPQAPPIAARAKLLQEAASIAAMPSAMDYRRVLAEPDRERYAAIDSNPVRRVAEHPLSTFSLDVDTGAYANVRRMLMQGRLPHSDAVRVEELINYFAYQDPLPQAGEDPFRVTLELGPNPWNAKTRLLRVAVRSPAVDSSELPPANLVFLIDVSGSMQARDKLPLLKQSLSMLARQLDADDRVGIVVYAGASGVVLEPTPGDRVATIEQALEQLQAGGSTNGAAGIQLAYAKAREAFIPGGINRVLIATDGDFNVGTVDHQALLDLVERNRDSGIALTTLGFGSGNYNDQLMEQLADHGNGNHAYIDSLLEARKVLVEEVGGTLNTVARDVKVQVEFNPAHVAEYRLIGYENRLLAREDFNNDQVDAGDIGAGHSVVALYEVALTGHGGERIEALRYAPAASVPVDVRDELALVRLRYKQPQGGPSRLLSIPLAASAEVSSLAETSDDYRFAAAVAAFGQRLRGGTYLEGFDYAQITELARASRGADPHGHRGDFLRVAGLAHSLQPAAPSQGGH